MKQPTIHREGSVLVANNPIARPFRPFQVASADIGRTTCEGVKSRVFSVIRGNSDSPPIQHRWEIRAASLEKFE